VLAGKYDTTKAAAEYADLKKNEAKLQVIGGELQKDMEQKKWDDAMAKVAEVEKLLPADERDNLDLLRFNILLGKKDYTAAYKLAAKTSEAHKDNSDLQHQLAWQIASDDTIEQRDLNLAATIAARANEAAKGKDPGILDTQARILFMQGKKSEAIQMEEKALTIADDDQKKLLQKTIDSYREGKLPKVE
jgi:tetratricopeptide (TPR) repeat protein